MKNFNQSRFTFRIVTLFLHVIFFLTGANLTGQVPEIVKEKCFGGNGWEIPYSLELTNDSGYTVFGLSTSTDGDVRGNHGDRDLWLLKLDAEFDTLWTKYYGGSNREWAAKILQTQDSGYILCGMTYSFDGDVHGNHSDNDNGDAWIIKLNARGDTLWTKCFGGSKSDDANTIVEIPNEGYIMSGLTGSVDGDVHDNHGNFDLWVVKIDLAGDTLWTKCYGGTGTDVAEAMTVTHDGAFVIAGYSSSNDGDVHENNGDTDFFIMKINDSGDTLWTKSYGGSNSDGIYSIKLTSDNGFIVTGYTASNDFDVQGNHGDYDAWVMKLDKDGQKVWKSCFGGSGSDYTSEILQTLDGGYLCAGYTESSDGDVLANHGERDAWLIKLDTEGNVLWAHCFGGSSYDEIQDIQSVDDGFVFAGFSNSNDGDVLSERFESHDYWMVKLIIPDELDLISVNTNLKCVYPNPNSGVLFIKDESMDHVQVLDMTGKVLLQSKEKEINMATYNAGLYIVKLFDKTGQTTTIKLIKR